MSKYEYRNMYLRQSQLNQNIIENAEPIQKIQSFNLETILNQWGDLNWELIDIEYEYNRPISNMHGGNYSLNFFLFFKRELKDDLTPNKSNKYEYRILIENPSFPFNKDQQDKYFLGWIKEGFEIVKNLTIKSYPRMPEFSPFMGMVYIFKRKVSK